MWRQIGGLLLLRHSASWFIFPLVQLITLKICLVNVQYDIQAFLLRVFIKVICFRSLVLFDSATLDIYIYVYYWKHASSVVIGHKLSCCIYAFLFLVQIGLFLHFICLLSDNNFVCFPFRAFQNIFLLLNILYHHFLRNWCV